VVRGYQRVVSFLAGISRRVLSVLVPNWRWMLVIVGAGCLYEAGSFPYVLRSQLEPWRVLASVLCSVAALILFWLASRPALPDWLRDGWRRAPRIVRWRIWRALITAMLIWLAWSHTSPQLRPMLHGRYTNDAIAYVHADALLLLQHRNIYAANDAFWTSAARWPTALATPLLGGKTFGSDAITYPSWNEIYNILHYEVKTPQARAFGDFDPQTVHNYPAGIAWLAAPLIAAGVPSVIWLNLLALVVLFGLVLARAPAPVRFAALIALLADPVIPQYSIFANFDVVCLVFVLAAWQTMSRSWASGLLFGFAGAVKQVAWFFVPFYLIEVVRRYGWRTAFQHALWAAPAFLLPNLPFLLASPKAWLHSVLVPMTDPMYPLGVGPVQLSLSGWMPLWPPLVWTALEALSFAGLIVFQCLRRNGHNSDGLFLALIPLWISWRSPMNYFAFLAVVALWIALDFQRARQAQPLPELEAASSEPFAEPIEASLPEPELVGA
jgi:hypothetical protein